ncbi:MAG: MaoC family dehydratase N-terminal domain-containing protein, partial [Actinobacteria bacterium]|nr:MaoC family dehydratase N-terminal domain-containing protein [Actinomycetota bacterium]
MTDQVIEFELPIERDKVREFALAVGEDNHFFFDPEAAHLEGFPDVLAPPTFTQTQIFRVSR